MPRVVIERGFNKGLTIELSKTKPLVFGRDEGCDVVLRDQMISRHHFKIHFVDDAYCIVDLHSLNGTMVDNRRITGPVALKHGSLIQAGQVLLTFISDEGEEIGLGAVLGGYKLLERIGRGGMGTVYKALQIGLGRTVALKLIAAQHVKDLGLAETLLREARVSATLNHPNIVQVYDVKWDEKYYYYSMEFMPGGSLRALLAKEQALSFKHALPLMLDMARGLEHAHKKGVIHGDIKPDNMLIAEDKTVKICDFGLARKLHEPTEDAEKTGLVYGTPYYIAPELVRGSRTLSYRSDMYSLGATFYELLAGTPPFIAESVKELFHKKITQVPRPLSDFVPMIPNKVNSVVARMLEREPDKRYPSMSDVVTELEELKQATVGVKTPSRFILAPEKKIPKPIIIAGIILILAVIAALGFLIFKPEYAPKDEKHPTHYQQEASLLLKNAVEFFKQNYKEDLSDEDKISIREEFSKMLESIIISYPDTTASREARQLAEDNRNKIKTIRKNIFDRQWNQNLNECKSNYISLVQLLAGDIPYAEAMGYIDQTYNQTVEKLSVFLKSEFSQIVTDTLKDVEMWYEVCKKCWQKFQQVLKTNDALILQRKYQEAWNNMDSLEKEVFSQRVILTGKLYEDVFFNQFALREKKRIYSLAQKDFKKVLTEVDKLMEEQKFDDAITLLKEVVNNFGVPGVVKEANQRITELEDRKKQIQDEIKRQRYDEMRQKDKDICTKAVLEAYEHIKKYEFLKADKPLLDALNQQKTEEFKSYLFNRIEKINMCQKIFSDFILKANSASPQFAVKVDEEKYKIKSITSEWVELEMRPNIYVRRNIMEIFPPEKLLTFIRDLSMDEKKWKFSTDDYKNLIIFYAEYGFYGELLNLLLFVEKKFKDEKDLQDFVQQIRASVKNYQYSGCDELEAVKLFDRICAYREQARYSEAKPLLKVLVNKFKDTEIFKKNRSQIYKWLKE